MLNKFFFALLFSINLYSSFAQSKIVVFVVYSDFANPREVYDSLTNQISEQKLVDSIKIIGRPILFSSVDVEIDTSRAILFGIPIDGIQQEIKGLEKYNDLNILKEIPLISRTGELFRLKDIAKLSYTSKLYKPQLFIPLPEIAYHKGRKAVKIVCFCKPGKNNQLIKYFPIIINRYKDIRLKTDFEIVKLN